MHAISAVKYHLIVGKHRSWVTQKQIRQRGPLLM